jgi:hypothetical protein
MVTSSFKQLRLGAVPDFVEAEGSWRSPSQNNVLLRKGKTFQGDAPLEDNIAEFNYF